MRVFLAALVLLLVLPATGSADVGDKLSNRTLSMLVLGDANGLQVQSAWFVDEPFLEMPPLDEGEQPGLELLDQSGQTLYRGRLRSPILLPQPSGTTCLFRGAPSFSVLIRIPELPNVHKAALYVEDGLTQAKSPYIIDIGSLPPLVDLGQPPPSLEIRLLHGRGGLGWSQRVDFVFVAEGYTPAEKEKFFTVAQQYTDYILELEPWQRYKERINFSAVFRASNSSGVSLDSNVIDTAYGVHFNSSYTKEPTNFWEVAPLMQSDAAWAHADYTFGLINYRPLLQIGKGDLNIGVTVIGGENFNQVLVFKHEMEHWGSLDHEDTGWAGDRSHPSCVLPYDRSWIRNIDFKEDCRKWGPHWIGDEGVGCYPGGLGCHDDRWRPTTDCGMSLLYSRPICPICRQAITYELISNSINASRVTPLSSEVELKWFEWKTFEVSAATSDSIIQWYFDDGIVAEKFVGTGPAYILNNPGYVTGRRLKLRAVIIDPTRWIRHPQDWVDKLHSEITWEIVTTGQ